MEATSVKIMKTTGKISVALVFSALLLYFAMCQKEDTVTPMNQNVTQVSNDKTSPMHVELPMIIIEHQRLWKLLSQYNVIVMPSGNAIYNGWNNTYVLGQKKFQVKTQIMEQLKLKFIISGLYASYNRSGNNAGVNENPDMSSTEILCMPPESRPQPVALSYLRVLTSFRIATDNLLVTLRDDYQKPVDLIKLWTETEKLLGIDAFVQGEP